MLLNDNMTDQAHELSGQGAKDVHLPSAKKLSRKSCLKCLRDGDVLICSDVNCPIVVHKSCMACPARFDDSGNFYCPYCLYKKALNECQQAKEQALLAKKALVTFLDAKISRSSADLKISESRKRKNTDVATDDPNKNDCSSRKKERVEVHKLKQVSGAQQSASPEIGTLAGNIKQAGPTTNNICKGTLSATEEVGNLITKCDDTVTIVTGHGNARTEWKPTQEKPQAVLQGQYRTYEGQSRPKKWKDASYSARSGNASLMSEDRGNLATENQEKDGNLDIWANKEKKQTEPCNPAKENVEEVCEEFMEGIYGSPKDENILGSQIARNSQSTCQVSNFGEGCFRRADEVQTQVRFAEIAVNPARTEREGAAFDESDSLDMSESSKESHNNDMLYSDHSKRRVLVPTYSECGDQSRESSGSIGSDFEGSQEANPEKTRQKVDSVQRTQHPPLPTAKRKKLPWAVEEVDALKEGVQTFSLTANKNLPWRKVLEYGRHIFDGTRTPEDLKDKWKNLVGKAYKNATKN